MSIQHIWCCRGVSFRCVLAWPGSKAPPWEVVTAAVKGVWPGWAVSAVQQVLGTVTISQRFMSQKSHEEGSWKAYRGRGADSVSVLWWLVFPWGTDRILQLKGCGEMLLKLSAPGNTCEECLTKKGKEHNESKFLAKFGYVISSATAANFCSPPAGPHIVLLYWQWRHLIGLLWIVMGKKLTFQVCLDGPCHSKHSTLIDKWNKSNKYEEQFIWFVRLHFPNGLLFVPLLAGEQIKRDCCKLPIHKQRLYCTV